MSKTPVVIPVVLCGGAGTRLWPVSRQAHPKPFIKVGSESLLAQTVRRCAGLTDQGLLLVSNKAYEYLIQDEVVPVVAGGSITHVHQLLEPSGRNTAPAIALAALWAHDNNPDAVLLVLPADHLISPVEQFHKAAHTAIAAAQTGALVCFGIQPTTPETGFGYIQVGEAATGMAEQGVKTVQRFVEKPDAATALQYLTSGEYLWNGGMFAFTAQVVLDALTQYAPDVVAAARSVWTAATQHTKKPVHGVALSVTHFDADAFATLPDISIDYAVMEKASNVAVVPAQFAWSDIGSWTALAQQQTLDQHGNSVCAPDEQQVIQIKSTNTHVHATKRMVATLGVQDLLIIDTEDALLVADKSAHQEVKQVVAQLKARGSALTEYHPTVHRPWGTYTVLEDAKGYKIKRIEVKPGASLSLQMHHHRSEHWIVVSGTAEVTNGDQVLLVRKNESTYIPAGHRHRLQNPGRLNLVMIEVQSGDYLEEDDIVRFEDTYGRV